MFEDKTSYKVGYMLGDVLFGFLRLLYHGIVTISIKYKAVLIAYICMICGMVLTFIAYDSISFFAFLFFATAVCSGIANNIIMRPLKKRRQYFTNVFTEIKLQAKDESVPYFLSEEELSEYTVGLAFRSLIPLSEWQKKQEVMEMYFNEKILKICQNHEDNRVTLIVIQKSSLPEYIEWEDRYMESENILSIGMGYFGRVSLDLKQYPHWFIAGETGSGKSNVLKCLIHQSLLKKSEVILIDFKRAVSFVNFSGAVRVYYEYDETMNLLENMVEETKRRLDLFREKRVDNLESYNRITQNHLHRKVIFIDELAELLKVRDKEISNSLYDSLETLTRLSRAVGIHLIMGIQRPDSTIVNGQIKNNVTGRLCGRFVDKEPSRIMLNSDEASKLPNIKGRFIIKRDDLEEIQCFYYEDTYVHSGDFVFTGDTNDKEANLDINETEEKEVDKATDTVQDISFDFSDIEK